MKNGQKTQKGITFLEVLIVFTLLGIILGFSIPLFTTFTSKERLASVAQSLQSDMRKARTKAIATQANVSVIFQTGATWCYGVTTAATCDCSTTAACNLGQVTNAEFPDTTLSLTGFASSKIVFDSSRGTPDASGTATFTGIDGNAITVNLNKLGVTRICGTGIRGYPSC